MKALAKGGRIIPKPGLVPRFRRDRGPISEQAFTLNPSAENEDRSEKEISMFGSGTSEIRSLSNDDPVFIVHGRNEGNIAQVQLVVARLGLKPVILIRVRKRGKHLD